MLCVKVYLFKLMSSYSTRRTLCQVCLQKVQTSTNAMPFFIVFARWQHYIWWRFFYLAAVKNPSILFWIQILIWITAKSFS